MRTEGMIWDRRVDWQTTGTHLGSTDYYFSSPWEGTKLQPPKKLYVNPIVPSKVDTIWGVWESCYNISQSHILST